MNAQERDQLQQFLATLRQQRVPSKDAVADALIREALSSQPDATYLLVQRAMALTLALEATQNQLRQREATCAPSDPPSQPAPGPQAVHTSPPSLWRRGLVEHMGSTALGVAAGVVAGGALLQGLQSLWGDDAPSPASGLGGTPADKPSASASEGDAGLWDLGEDWA